MPGNCPAGAWVKQRAHRIMAEGDAPKHIAYALAVEQGHKLGKTPKDFRTEKGVREAKEKYDEPKSTYQKTAMFAALFDELDQMEKDGMGWFGRKVVAPLAIAGGLAGGGAKLMSHMGVKAPTAITQMAERGVSKMLPPVGSRMLGGKTTAVQSAMREAGM